MKGEPHWTYDSCLHNSSAWKWHPYRVCYKLGDLVRFPRYAIWGHKPPSSQRKYLWVATIQTAAKNVQLTINNNGLTFVSTIFHGLSTFPTLARTFKVEHPDIGSGDRVDYIERVVMWGSVIFEDICNSLELRNQGHGHQEGIERVRACWWASVGLLDLLGH